MSRDAGRQPPGRSRPAVAMNAVASASASIPKPIAPCPRLSRQVPQEPAAPNSVAPTGNRYAVITIGYAGRRSGAHGTEHRDESHRARWLLGVGSCVCDSTGERS
jgi:hypothetical protein